MNKVMYVMVIILMIPFLLKSQNKILTQVNNPGGDRFHLKGDCTYEAIFTVTVANLDLLHETTCENGQILSLPEGYPPMKLRMEISNIEQTVPVETFVQKSCNIISIYEFTYIMVVDLSSECIGGDPLENFNVNVSSALLTDTKTMQETYYPVCLYSSLNDLFPCIIFEETAAYCNSDPPPCPGAGATTDTEVSCGEACVEHLASARFGGENPKEIEMMIEDFGFEKNTAVKIHPNPFNEKLNIHFDNTAEILRIQIYNIGGRLMKSWDNIQDTQLNVNTLEFEKGIYFLNVQMKDTAKSFKLIKS